MADENDFREWMRVAGFNGREVTKAGEAIGMPQSIAKNTSRGARELSETERLAMSAALAGLPPWTPEKTEAIKAAGVAADLILDVAEKIKPVRALASNDG